MAQSQNTRQWLTLPEHSGDFPPTGFAGRSNQWTLGDSSHTDPNINAPFNNNYNTPARTQRSVTFAPQNSTSDGIEHDAPHGVAPTFFNESSFRSPGALGIENKTALLSTPTGTAQALLDTAADNSSINNIFALLKSKLTNPTVVER